MTQPPRLSEPHCRRQAALCFHTQAALYYLVGVGLVFGVLLPTSGVAQAEDTTATATSTTSPTITMTQTPTASPTVTITATPTTTTTEADDSTATPTVTPTTTSADRFDPNEDFPNHAGVVIDFGNDLVMTECVDLGESGQSDGVQILEDTGLSIQKIIESTDADGREDAEVCMIHTQGCAVDGGLDCFCECDDTACNQWIYYEREADVWQRRWSAGKRDVTPGMVVGWVWGNTQAATVPEPISRSFSEICMLATPTPTITPIPTATDEPPPEQPGIVINREEPPRAQVYLPYLALSDVSTANAPAESTAVPTDLPTATPDLGPTATELPSPTPIVTTTATIALPTATSELTATATSVPPPTEPPPSATPSATLEATSEPLIPIDEATSEPLTTAMPAGMIPPAMPNAPRASAEQTLVANSPSPTQAAAVADSSAVEPPPRTTDARPQVAVNTEWIVLGLIILVVTTSMGLIVFLYRRQQQDALATELELNFEEEE